MDILDENRLTPLMWACAYGQLPTVQLLLSEGANVDQIGSEGETALHLAAAGGHQDVVRLLISKGANVNKPDDVSNSQSSYAGINQQSIERD